MDVEMFSQDTNQLLAKGAQGYLGVSTWWYIEELMGDYSKDYVFLPVLDGPDGTHNVTVRTGGGTNSGNLNVTNKCQSPANLLKFFDQWYDGETVMQLQYGPIGVFFTEQDANGKWKSITEEEAKAKYNKGAGELKSTYEVWGPKLIDPQRVLRQVLLHGGPRHRASDRPEGLLDALCGRHHHLPHRLRVHQRGTGHH